MSAASLALRYPSIRLLREAARGRLPKPVFDFADGGAEDEVTLGRNEAAFRRWSFLPRPLEGAATRDQSVRLFGKSLSLPVLDRPDRARRPLLAARRNRVGAGGGRRLHRLLPQPRLGVLDRGTRRAASRAALDAGVHLPRSRLHARADAARPRRGLRRADPDDRQSAARQARARPRQRLLDSAAILGPAVARDGREMALGMVDAARAAGADVRQLCPPRVERVARHARRPHGLATGSVDVLGRRRAIARGLAGPAAAEGHPAPRRGPPGGRAGGRRAHRFQPRRPPARRRGKLARRVARDRRRGRRSRAGADRRRDPARHRRRQGDRARGARRADRAAAALGSCGRGRSRRRARPRDLPLARSIG